MQPDIARVTLVTSSSPDLTPGAASVLLELVRLASKQMRPRKADEEAA